MLGSVKANTVRSEVLNTYGFATFAHDLITIQFSKLWAKECNSIPLTQMLSKHVTLKRRYLEVHIRLLPTRTRIANTRTGIIIFNLPDWEQMYINASQQH